MEMTKEQFNKKLDEVAESNWKVKKLLEDCGGYENFPEHLKPKLHEMMGVKVTTKFTSI